MTAVPAPIDFYFEFSSPYGYVASCLADELGKRTGRELNWRPILLGPIFKMVGTAPLTQLPLKGDYSKRDFVRTARYHQVPFRMPEAFPIGTVAAVRAFYWVHESDPAKARELAKALYAAYFREGRDISAPDAVTGIAGGLGIDAAALGAALGDAAVKERAKQEVDAAIAAGVFGSPFFIVGGEAFWGVDRMPMLEEWILRGGW